MAPRRDLQESEKKGLATRSLTCLGGSGECKHVLGFRVQGFGFRV